MTFADHFSTIAARYAAYRPHYPPALVDLLAALAPDHHLAWDAGCGTGQLSVDLARRFDQVIATDPSQAQLAAAEAAPRVAYRCEPAEASTLEPASCDLVVAAQAAHWFAWPRFVAEVGRVARPGALAALVSYGVPALDGRGMPPAGSTAEGRCGLIAGDAPLRAYRELIAGFWPPGREHVENGYRDLRWPWPALAAPAMELVEHGTRDELIGYVGTWSATVKLVAAQGAGAVEALAAALPERTYEVRWPLALVLARVAQ